jgi:hypothetical protein
MRRRRSVRRRPKLLSRLILPVAGSAGPMFGPGTTSSIGESASRLEDGFAAMNSSPTAASERRCRGYASLRGHDNSQAADPTGGPPLPRRASSEVGTQAGTARAFPASLAHLSRSTMRKRLGHYPQNGPGRSRTSARGFEVRRSSAELRGQPQGWRRGLEPPTTGTTTRGSTN